MATASEHLETTQKPLLTFAIDTDRDNIEALRQILEAVERRPINYGEAQEVGESLLDFYQILGQKVEDEPEI